MFKKILIANRGEIACRIIQTAKKLEIATVAVYSEADREARHVQLADEAVPIGPAPSRESYLVAANIIAAAKSTGAQAIHPGYGFLSENADFAKLVEDEGIVFIGPKYYSIAAMGDKIASKILASQAGVNTVPGCNEVVDSPESAVRVANGIGYPVMIKASAGGGGKGLRVAFNDQEVFDGVGACGNEAKASFGDDRVFIEKYIEGARHIEIQLLGDAHGNVVYLYERECSIQHRHQKLLEEAPSRFVSDATRRAMGEQAVALAKAVHYQSAGTVEFVVGKDQHFYFLEMNTRLQVEHPVTECITGLDLVELMIRIAAGETLPMTQAEVRCDGWAIECRINAEDSFRGFMPSTGRLVRYSPPPTNLYAAGLMAEGGGVRVDTGVYEGGAISMHYDSMIAKLIVHGRDRGDAITRMREALNGFVIRGIRTNLPLQASLLAHPSFVEGEVDTGFIANHYHRGPGNAELLNGNTVFLVACAAFVHRRICERDTRISDRLAGQNANIPCDVVVVVLDRKGVHGYHNVRINPIDSCAGSFKVRISEHCYAIKSEFALGDIVISGICNNKPFTAQVERGGAPNSLAIRIAHNGLRIAVLVMPPRAAELFKRMPQKPLRRTSKILVSPLPGLLVDIMVEPGQQVRAGERLAVIEAMKMENILTAEHDGTVAKLLARKGENLAIDQPILSFA